MIWIGRKGEGGYGHPLFIMNNLESMTIHMVIASYLSKDPDQQIKNMARRYYNSTKDVSERKSLRRVISSRKPVLLVRTVYEEIN